MSATTLIERISGVFSELPDARGQSNNRRYVIQDAALSAFSVFFSQSPSFLDSQIRMQKQQGRNNASSLFGVHEIPCDNQIRNLLDPVAPETLFPLMASLGDELYSQGYLEAFRSINETFLIALDGTDFFSSEKISCPRCSQSKLKNGKTLNRHIAVTPTLVAPGQKSVLALPPQFVLPQDGHDKQDCELAAAGRWLDQWGAHYRPWGITYLGDDLYCHQPHCERVLDQQADFLFTCKPDSHSTLYEWVADFARCAKVTTVVHSRRTGKKQFTDTYRYVNHVPLRDTDDALMVNWCELVTTDQDNTVLFHNAWATSHRVTEDNVARLAVAGRTRWKIENENNNTLKTKGYHLEHNFGHGKKPLSSLLATMNILAFLFHTVLGFTDNRYRLVRTALPSRATFFQHMSTLSHYLPFPSWNGLLRFMMRGLEIGPYAKPP